MIIEVKDIIIDDEINIRELDEDLVEEYATSMEAYELEHWIDHWKSKPIITEDRHLWSGFHTVEAVKRAFGENAQVEAEVKGRNKRDAMFLATGTNADHGKRRTNEDKRKAVLRWLEDEENRQWTNGHIAEKCFVGRNFVRTLSEEVDLKATSPRPTYRKYEHYGGIAWMETAKPDPHPDFLDQIEEATADPPSDPEPEPISNSIPPYDDMDDVNDPDYTEPKGRFENPLYEDPMDKWEDDSEKEEKDSESPKVEAKEEHEDHEYEPDPLNIKIDLDIGAWEMVIRSIVARVESLSKISVKDVDQLQRDFRRGLHANSTYVSSWLNDRDKDYQHNWNQLFRAMDRALDGLRTLVETRAADGENLKKKYGVPDETKQ